MIRGVGNIANVLELRKRLFFTFMILAVYRVGCAIPVPGINSDELSLFFAKYKGTLLSFVDMFSGGALERMSVFALGIMPYISASILFELLTVVVPSFAALKKDGENGRRRILKYTRYSTMLLSFVQGFGIAIGLESMVSLGGGSIVPNPGWEFRIMTMITLSSGTALIMWLGERITEKGIGNGISLIIFSGIVARMPSAMMNTFRMVSLGEVSLFILLFILFVMVFIIGGICFVEQGQRRLPVQYAKRVIGRRMFGGQNTHMPLKINPSGVIPPIFASSVMMFPATLTQFIQVEWVQSLSRFIMPGGLFYNLVYIVLISFFVFFYTAISFNSTDISNNMKKFGGFIPGIRPGRRTAEYIDKILSRILLGGAVYLSVVCVLPTLLISQFNVPFYFGGTALLIVVGVALDTMSQIEGYVIQRNYDSLFKRMK